MEELLGGTAVFCSSNDCSVFSGDVLVVFREDLHGVILWDFLHGVRCVVAQEGGGM